MQELLLQNKTTTTESEIIDLLCRLIKTPSFSKDEEKTADLLVNFFEEKGIAVQRYLNNVWAKNKHFDECKPTILLNSHHDTVKPNTAYTVDPFQAFIEDGKLFGLGSNDAGGCLVSLIACFLYFYERKDLKFNLIFAASAEEEISGNNGIEALLPLLGEIAFGIVGEPTQMNLAVAEKGLLVLDCVSKGKAGHAAREEGNNAIYHALRGIRWIKDHQFEKVSTLLGPVKMSVTSIETSNKAHNVVPDQCTFIVDIRVNELYSHEEILAEIKKNVSCDIKPRSFRIRSSSIPFDHPLVKAGLELGKNCYGSPTTSDKALMKFPTLKMGPGDSARSHTPDEFVYVNEIKEGIDLYIKLIGQIIN